MKVVAISDTHGTHSSIVLPEGELLAVAGDWTMMGEFDETVDFIVWLAEKSKDFKYGSVLISGNHDWMDQRDPYTFQGLIQSWPQIRYLRNQTIQIEDKVIHGTPVSPYFHGWAFNYLRGADIDRFWERIPEDCDLLITHTPPHKILDYVPRTNTHAGCQDLRRRIFEKRVKNNVFGHIHPGYGHLHLDGCNFYNAAQLDDSYKIANVPLVFEI